MHPDFNILSKIDRFEICDVDIREDHANLHEGLVFGEQSQLNQIGYAGLFEVGKVFGIVDVPLWIQIPVTDFDGVIETKIAHGAIIVG